MKAKKLVSFILLSTFVILLCSASAQATEYREVNKKINASDILTHIERGDDILIDNCSIVGELDVSKIKLESVPNPRQAKIWIEELMDDINSVDSKIEIKNSIFENGIKFSDVLFQKPLIFKDVKIKGPVDFSDTTFNCIADYKGENDSSHTPFAGSADFDGLSFYGPVDFSYSTFNGFASFYARFNESADFAQTTFNGDAYFSNSKFNGGVDFSDSIFNESADFSDTRFIRSADFSDSTFIRSADFSDSTFNESADFSDLMFNGNAYFDRTIFEDSNKFTDSTFNESADFSDSIFNGDSYFNGTILKDSAVLKGPNNFKNIIINSGSTCNLFRTYYKNKGQFVDANNIYYDYRNEVLAEKSWGMPSKWFDFICLITCGYGLKPQFTLIFGGILIIIFSFFYRLGPKIYLNCENKIPIGFKLQGSLIYRPKGVTEDNSKVTFWDALYFSIIRFTNAGSTEWNTKDRIWSTCEGLLGWTMLGIFMATLTNVMINLNF
jgi:hypothetical protein